MKYFWISIKKKENCLFSRRNGYKGKIIIGYSVIIRLFGKDILQRRQQMAIKTILTCDNKGCKNTLELAGPYHVCKKEMKEVGWKNKKIGEEWKIICKECGNV